LSDLEDGDYPTSDELVFWARTLHAVDEEYLDRVRTVTEDEQPWQKLMSAAQELCRRAPTGKFEADRELAQACGYVEAARRNLRNVCYFYVRTRRGARKAELAFPNARQDVHERVLSLVYPE
jgi:hypothetical protein